MYGLEQEDIQKINTVFKNHSAIEKVILYGSRAKGNYRDGSDIDLTMVGKKLDLAQQFTIETELDDLLLPYKIDLSIFHKIENQDLIDHIERVGIIFYENKALLKEEKEQEWIEFKLLDLVEIYNHVRVPLSKMQRDKRKGDFPYYGASGVIDYVDDFLFDGEYVLISEDGENLKSRKTPIAFKANGKFWVNNHAHIIKGKEGLYNDLVVYYFQNLNLTPFITGAVQPKLNKANLLSIPIWLPKNKNEQKAITNVLISLDNKIDLLQRQNKTLEALAKNLFRQWLIEEEKEDWEQESLSSIAVFLNGLACQKYPPKNDVDKLPVLKIRELKEGFSDNSDWASTDVDKKYLVSNGDVIFSWSASLVVKIWDGGDCILNQHLFKVTSEDYPKWFYYLWCKYHLAVFISIAKAHATTMGHIKRGDLDDAMVAIPSPKELEKMGETFAPMIDKIITNNKQIKTLEKTRDTLLPKLMSGEVRVMMN